jgi:hypothetical protein
MYFKQKNLISPDTSQVSGQRWSPYLQTEGMEDNVLLGQGYRTRHGLVTYEHGAMVWWWLAGETEELLRQTCHTATLSTRSHSNVHTVFLGWKTCWIAIGPKNNQSSKALNFAISYLSALFQAYAEMMYTRLNMVGYMRNVCYQTFLKRSYTALVGYSWKGKKRDGLLCCIIYIACIALENSRWD